MRLIDADTVVTIPVYDDMLETIDTKKMSIADAIDEWSDEGCPSAVDVDSLNAKHEDIGYEKGYRDGYAEALYETNDAGITLEQVKEYCRRRCLVIVAAETFNDMKAIWNLLQPDDYEEGEEE